MLTVWIHSFRQPFRAVENVLQIRGVGNQERGMNPNHSIV